MDDNKRQNILFAAMKLFNERGFHNTPTSLISKKAKVSVGTLFNYFPSKEVLIHELYISIRVHSKSMFMELIEDHVSHHDKLLSMWKAVIKWGISNPEEFHYTELYLNSPFKKTISDHAVFAEFESFKESVMTAISPITICDSYPEYSMYYIDHAIHATTNFILNTEIDDVDRFIRSSFDMLWYGFSDEV